MKQILQSYRSGELWLADVPAPAPRSGGVVVRTAASLVSAGTERMIMELAQKSLLGKARARPDLVKKVIAKVKTEGLFPTLEKVFAKLDTPVPLGYSCAGTVIEAGDRASELKVGERVACGGAGYASHAEFNFVPKNLCVKIPEPVGFEDASFTTLGAIAMQGVRQADVRLGERVAVVGLGLLGLLTVQILKASGCRVLGSDPDANKVLTAKELGADEAVAADLTAAALPFSEGYGVDAVIITAATASNQPLEEAAEICRTKGRVVVVGMVGMHVPRDPFYKKELDLRLSMSYGPGRYDSSYEEGGRDYPYGYVRWTEQRNMQSFLELVAAGRVTPSRIVTHRFPIDEALAAYALLDSPDKSYLAVLVTYPQAERATVLRRTVDLSVRAGDGKLGIGFIGAGNFAKGVLIPALKRVDGIELVGLCTATGMSAVETGKKHQFAYATTDVQKLLGDPRIQAVFIATRHDSHAELVAQALAAEKHVFVEKPLCVTAPQLKQVQDAVQKSKRLLMVGFNRRFSPHAVALRQAFTERRTPMVISYRINAGTVPKESWVQDATVGGGRVVGEICHFVDLCDFLVGAAPATVHAESIVSNDSRLTPEDSIAVTIRYADGSLATIQYVALGPADLGKERIEVFADGRAAVVEDFKRTSFYGGGRTLRTPQDKGFASEMASFVEAMRRGGQAPIPLDSLVRTTRLTFQILESLRRGSAVDAAAGTADAESALCG